MVTQVQTLAKAVCISHNANTLRKGTNPTILSLTMGKRHGRLSFVILIWLAQSAGAVEYSDYCSAKE